MLHGRRTRRSVTSLWAMGLTITRIRAGVTSNRPAGRPSAPLAGAGCLSPLAALLKLAHIAEFDVRLLAERHASSRGGAPAVELGVELGTEQDRDVGDPQPQ